jgi:hypothetical protein
MGRFCLLLLCSDRCEMRQPSRGTIDSKRVPFLAALDAQLCGIRPLVGITLLNAAPGHSACIIIITNLAELHEDVHHAEEVPPRHGRSRGAARHELLVQMQLSSRERAHDHVLVLARELLLHVLFQATQQERAHDGVQPLDQPVVDGARALHLRVDKRG